MLTAVFHEDVVAIEPFTGPVTLELLLPDCVITVSNLHTHAANVVCERHNIDYERIVLLAKEHMSRVVQIDVVKYHEAKKDKTS